MTTPTGLPLLRQALTDWLTPALWRQAHHAGTAHRRSSRWSLQPLVWVLLGLAWASGDSQHERFATARAVFVACHQHDKRPGHSLDGFLKALARVPLAVLRAFAAGMRQQLLRRLAGVWRWHGFLPLGCDGTRLECPRSRELQQRLGEAGKPHSAPMIYLSTLVLLPLGIPWAWQWGQGTASEHTHLRRMLPTVPPAALIVADAFYFGYHLFADIVAAKASFLIRLSSRAHLYTTERRSLKRFVEGVVYFWPQAARQAQWPPLKCRLLRIRGDKADVWLLTDVLDSQRLTLAWASQLYRWRWHNEGLFRVYKRQLAKTKLQSRTVALVHREAEGAMLGLQLLMALSVQQRRGCGVRVALGSPRQTLLVLRGDMQACVRELGPRQFADYQRQLAEVHRDRPGRQRVSSKVRQKWPRRKDHKPPKPPKLRVMNAEFKAKVHKMLNKQKVT